MFGRMRRYKHLLATLLFGEPTYRYYADFEICGTQPGGITCSGCGGHVFGKVPDQNWWECVNPHCFVRGGHSK
jgi:hypothetical protein